MILLNIKSGLGDRFFSWMNLYQCSVDNNLDVVYIWNRDNSRNNFSYYFDIKELKIVNDNDIDIKKYNFDVKIICIPAEGKCNDNILFAKQVERYIKGEITNLYYRASTRGVGLRITNLKYYKLIKPSCIIQEKLDNYIKENNFHNMIGMHIRRTDHKPCIKNSPVYLFENKINELINKNNEVKIFLCTDDNLVKNELKNKYPNNILSREIKSRHEKRGMEDAVIDMFLLSKCEKIYGSYNSGFGRLSASIGNVSFIGLHV